MTSRVRYHAYRACCFKWDASALSPSVVNHGWRSYFRKASAYTRANKGCLPRLASHAMSLSSFNAEQRFTKQRLSQVMRELSSARTYRRWFGFSQWPRARNWSRDRKFVEVSTLCWFVGPLGSTNEKTTPNLTTRFVWITLLHNVDHWRSSRPRFLIFPSARKLWMIIYRSCWTAMSEKSCLLFRCAR